MTRYQLFERVLAMMSRISELQEKYSWSDEDTQHAISLLDDAAPVDLHLMGLYLLPSYVRINCYSQHSYDQHLSPLS